MKLTWLADGFRSVGLRVVEEPDWEDRGKAWLRGRPIGALQHHTAEPVSLLRDTGNGLTEDEANTIYARRNHSH